MQSFFNKRRKSCAVMLNQSFSTVSSNDSSSKDLSFSYEALLEKSLNHVSQWSIYDQSAHMKDNEDSTLTWGKKKSSEINLKFVITHMNFRRRWVK